MVEPGLYAGVERYGCMTRYVLISPIGNSYATAVYVEGTGQLELAVTVDDPEGVPDPAECGCTLQDEHCRSVWTELVTHGVSCYIGMSLDLCTDDVVKANNLVRVLHECGLGPFKTVCVYNEEGDCVDIPVTAPDKK